MNKFIKSLSVLFLVCAMLISFKPSISYAKDFSSTEQGQTTVQDESTQPYALRCNICYGVLKSSTTRTYEHDERFTCTHYLNSTGKDTYKVYEVRTTTKCTACGHVSTSSYEDHVLISCTGK